MARIRLDVVTPEKSIAKDLAVESVILPGTNGQMNVLPGHVNLLTSLRAGSFAYLYNGVWQWAVLGGGFAEVVGERVIVLAETMELRHELDLARAELALKRAQETLKSETHGTDGYNSARSAQERAEARLRFAKERGLP